VAYQWLKALAKMAKAWLAAPSCGMRRMQRKRLAGGGNRGISKIGENNGWRS